MLQRTPSAIRWLMAVGASSNEHAEDPRRLWVHTGAFPMRLFAMEALSATVVFCDGGTQCFLRWRHSVATVCTLSARPSASQKAAWGWGTRLCVYPRDVETRVVYEIERFLMGILTCHKGACKLQSCYLQSLEQCIAWSMRLARREGKALSLLRS